MDMSYYGQADRTDWTDRAEAGGWGAELPLPISVKTTDGTRWGYIDRAGRMAIRPRYDYAFDFQRNGLAVVHDGGRAGLIRADGRYAVPPIYDSIGPFSEGRAVVSDREGFKLMDESGRIVTQRAYSYLQSLQEGRAVFTTGAEEGSRYGYLDASGREVIPARYQEASGFRRGRALVKTADGRYALIRPDGSTIVTYPYPFVGQPGDGLLPYREQPDGRYGYIDESGAVRIKPQYTGAMPFTEGRAVINTAEDYGSRYGLIDRKGHTIILPGYNDIREMGEGRYAIGRAIDLDRPYMGSVYAIADANGKRLTDFRYYGVSDYHGGLASVYDNRHTYFIDRSGKAAPGYPRFEGSGTLEMKEGIVRADIDRRTGYYRRDGRPVWQPDPVIPLRPPYRVRERKYRPNRNYLVYYPVVEGMSDVQAQQRINEKLKEWSLVKPVPADAELDYEYDGDFSVSFFRKDLLVLELEGYNYPLGAAHGMPTRKHVHIDVAHGNLYTLADLFKPGSDYVTVLSGIVGEMIKTDPQYDYVFPGSYTGIKADQPFYVTEDALHLYFAPYEIAPYAAGFPTFAIPFARIRDIIDTDGAFWRSFHAGRPPG